MSSKSVEIEWKDVFSAMDSHLRSIAKALTWRMGGIVVTGFVAYVVTGKLSTAAGIAGFDGVLKLGAYYVHERVWGRIKLGQAKPPEYQI